MKRKGFTIVELLFVILFIGILVLVTIAMLNSSRESARDASRLVDIRRIQTALEFYQIEYGSYPVVSQALILGEARAGKLCDEDAGGFVSAQTGCAVTFMEPVPSDPSRTMSYQYIGNEDGYTIAFTTETETRLGLPGTYFAHSEGINTNPEIQ